MFFLPVERFVICGQQFAHSDTTVAYEKVKLKGSKDKGLSPYLPMNSVRRRGGRGGAGRGGGGGGGGGGRGA